MYSALGDAAPFMLELDDESNSGGGNSPIRDLVDDFNQGLLAPDGSPGSDSPLNAVPSTAHPLTPASTLPPIVSRAPFNYVPILFAAGFAALALLARSKARR